MTDYLNQAYNSGVYDILGEDPNGTSFLSPLQGALSPMQQRPAQAMPMQQMAPTAPPASFQGLSPQQAITGGGFGGAIGQGGMPSQLNIDPNDVRKAALTDFFNQSSGGLVGGNVYQAQINQQMANYKLQQERMKALQNKRSDDPFYEYEQAKSRGYFAPNEGETEDQAFRRYTQERFKNQGQSVYSERMGDLSNLMGGNRDMATKLEAGLLETRKSDDGTEYVYDKASGQITTLVTPAQIAQGKALIAGTETRASSDAEANAKFRANAITSLDDSTAQAQLLTNVRDVTEDWLNKFESGDVDTGLINGLFAEIGIGPEEMGSLDYDTTRQKLANLGITNLAPVTVREIMMISKMWADQSAGKDINVGRLKAALRNVSTAIDDLEFERNKQLDTIKRYGGEDDFSYYSQRYGTTNNIEEVLNGGS